MNVTFQIERRWSGFWYPGTGYVDHDDAEKFTDVRQARRIVRLTIRRNAKYGHPAAQFRIVKITREVVE